MIATKEQPKTALNLVRADVAIKASNYSVIHRALKSFIHTMSRFN